VLAQSGVDAENLLRSASRNLVDKSMGKAFAIKVNLLALYTMSCSRLVWPSGILNAINEMTSHH
jgi:hypothetical protein